MTIKPAGASSWRSSAASERIPAVIDESSLIKQVDDFTLAPAA
jgi:hypothetical protein